MKPRYPSQLPTPIIQGNYYSAQQLMKIFSVNRSSVTYWARNNKLRTLKVGKTMLFPEEDVKKFLEERMELSEKKRGPAY